MKRIIAALAMCVVASAAQASVVVQNTLYTKSDENSWLSSGFGRSTWISQSFTPGVSGRLDRIDLQIGAIGSDDLRVHFGSGEAIEGTYSELFAIDIAAAGVPAGLGGLFSLDLSGEGLMLSAGSLYSVILSSTITGGGNPFQWVIGERNAAGDEFSVPPYAGGKAFASVNQGLTWSSRGVDRPLRTWMTAAVPEPATWAFMIVGFGLVGAAARRQRIAQA